MGQAADQFFMHPIPQIRLSLFPDIDGKPAPWNSVAPVTIQHQRQLSFGVKGSEKSPRPLRNPSNITASTGWSGVSCSVPAGTFTTDASDH